MFPVQCGILPALEAFNLGSLCLPFSTPMVGNLREAPNTGMEWDGMGCDGISNAPVLFLLITPTSWNTHMPSELRGLLVVPRFSLLEAQRPLLGKLLGDRVHWGSSP